MESERGQSLFETVLMVFLLTLLLSATIQIFLVHNYAYQMANNAYFSLFKDKAYNTYNKPSKGYAGYPNWPKKPLRTVKPLKGSGIATLGNAAATWSQDNRASVPMMPFFEEPIIRELRNIGVTREPVRLKIGSPIQGHNYLDMKWLYMGMGTEGGFGAFFEMISSLVQMAVKLGKGATTYTNGYSYGDLQNMQGDYDSSNNDLNSSEDGGKAQQEYAWDEAHGDYNHDGYNDACESVHGNNHPSCKNPRPW
jgi:hypothetical protein